MVTRFRPFDVSNTSCPFFFRGRAHAPFYPPPRWPVPFYCSVCPAVPCVQAKAYLADPSAFAAVAAPAAAADAPAAKAPEPEPEESEEEMGFGLFD